MIYGYSDDELQSDPRRTQILGRDIQFMIVRYPPDTKGSRAQVEISNDGLRVLQMADYTDEQRDRMIRDFQICYAKHYPPMEEAV